MRYPVAFEVGDESTAFGVVVPDLPGCCSAGDTLDEAFSAAVEAVALWIDVALDAGEKIPAPSALDDIRGRPDFAGWVFGFVQVDPAALDDTVDRVNITLPRRILARLDALAKAKGETRSGYIAQLTLVGHDI